MESMVSWARATAQMHLAPLGRRWTHVQTVVAVAERIAHTFGEEAEVLVASAYLHDIGYAPELAMTGFHPLDGARFLRDHGQERLAQLVAHHSGARLEAHLRGMTDYCDEFVFDESPLDHALTFCDLTTGPDGSRMTLLSRVEEINRRYGTDHVTARAISAGMDEFERACRLTEERVAASSHRIAGPVPSR